MISYIKGKIREIRKSSVLLECGNLTYEVLMPPALIASLTCLTGEPVELVTYHYAQVEPSRSVPVLIGFLNEVEKEFFEQFITVSGVGPKAACKALALPFSAIADGIDAGDIRLLKSLPGIGERKAREIIAKLQGRVGKFGLIRDRAQAAPVVVKEDVAEEALCVLEQLQYKKREAENMIARAIQRNPRATSAEELLNEVYRQRTETVDQSAVSGPNPGTT